MLGVEDLHHVSIAVTDAARSRRFYEGVLGLERIPRPDFDFDGAWYRLGDRQLHLIEDAGAKTLRGSREIDSHDGHFAVRVRSYRETRDHLEAAGIEIRDRPRNRTPWPQIYITDPDGNVIELNAAALDEELDGQLPAARDVGLDEASAEALDQELPSTAPPTCGRSKRRSSTR